MTTEMERLTGNRLVAMKGRRKDNLTDNSTGHSMESRMEQMSKEVSTAISTAHHQESMMVEAMAK